MTFRGDRFFRGQTDTRPVITATSSQQANKKRPLRGMPKRAFLSSCPSLVSLRSERLFKTLFNQPFFSIQS